MTHSFDLQTTQAGPVGEICFSRPPHNYASPELLAAIADVIEQMDADASVRAILLCSSGKSFCAGADLAGDAALASGDGMANIALLYAQAMRIFRRKKPVVAALQGAAIGAGLGLAVSADFRVASTAARLSANFVRLGFHPGFALTYTLPRLVGAQRASHMMLSAARIKPADALAWGLVDRVCAPEMLMQDTRAFAAEIASNAPLALLSVRATVMAGYATAAEAALQHEFARQKDLMATQDYAEGVASVFERRDAIFTGM